MNMLQTMAGALYDEMHADGDRGVRAHYRAFQSWLESQSADAIRRLGIGVRQDGPLAAPLEHQLEPRRAADRFRRTAIW